MTCTEDIAQQDRCCSCVGSFLLLGSPSGSQEVEGGSRSIAACAQQCLHSSNKCELLSRYLGRHPDQTQHWLHTL
eukprot:1161528-Pelagomonas_calceolata.AAC.3